MQFGAILFLRTTNYVYMQNLINLSSVLYVDPQDATKRRRSRKRLHASHRRWKFYGGSPFFSKSAEKNSATITHLFVSSFIHFQDFKFKKIYAHSRQ